MLSANASASTPLPRVDDRADSQVRATIPIHSDRNLIVMPISIAGSKPFNVVLDTGMPMRGIILYRSERVDALPLEFGESPHEVVGAGGNGQAAPTTVATGATIELGGLQLTDVAITRVETPHGFPPSHEGIIGLELFEQFAVRVDFDAQRVTLLDSATFAPPAGSSVLPMSLRNNIAFVDARVAVEKGDPIPVELAVDLGASHGLWLNTGKNGRIVAPKAGIDTRVGRGFSGPVEGHVGRVRRFELGEFAFDDLVAIFPGEKHQDPGGVHFKDGFVGSDMLRRFHVTFDYAGKRMVLERGASFGHPSEFDMSGMVLEPAGPNRRTVQIVLADSPAARAGVEVGDAVVAIDGKAIGDIGGDALLRTLRRDGAEVKLTIERGFEKMQKTIKLRRQV
jgi:PDZ domain/Aspartyl protease